MFTRKQSLGAPGELSVLANNYIKLINFGVWRLSKTLHIFIKMFKPVA